MCIYLPVKPWEKSFLNSPRNYDTHDNDIPRVTYNVFTATKEKPCHNPALRRRKREKKSDDLTQRRSRQLAMTWHYETVNDAAYGRMDYLSPPLSPVPLLAFVWLCYIMEKQWAKA